MSATTRAIFFGFALAIAPMFGCSSHAPTDGARSTPESTGDLGLQLRIGNLTVSSIEYSLSNGNHTYVGDLNVADAGTLSAVIGGVEQGSGYLLSLTAIATDGSPCLGSVGPFTVTANQTVTVGIELRCVQTRTRGATLIDGTVNECPDISSVVADPPNGCAISIHVAATDDGKPLPPGNLSYTWSGAAGLSGANPVLNCQTPGPTGLNVVVSDGDTKPGCDAPFGLTVICPPGCSTLAPTCLDGIQNQGETGTDCGGPCPIPCEERPVCLPPLRPGLGCASCEASNCPNDPTGCAVGTCTIQPACSDYPTQSQRNACSAVLSCARTTNCVAGGPLSCYCGTADLPHCISTTAPNANGVCKAQIEAGFETTSPLFILTNFLVVSISAGGALNLAQCDHDFCGNGSGNACVPFCQ